MGNPNPLNGQPPNQQKFRKPKTVRFVTRDLLFAL